MSSGSYFPPAVKAVDMPKKAGGTRTLGIPTVERPNCANDNSYFLITLLIGDEQELL